MARPSVSFEHDCRDPTLQWTDLRWELTQEKDRRRDLAAIPKVLSASPFGVHIARAILLLPLSLGSRTSKTAGIGLVARTEVHGTGNARMGGKTGSIVLLVRFIRFIKLLLGLGRHPLSRSPFSLHQTE
jgi:hypothetical protein